MPPAWKPLLTTLALAVFTLLASTAARADELLINGGFETGPSLAGPQSPGPAVTATCSSTTITRSPCLAFPLSALLPGASSP